MKILQKHFLMLKMMQELLKKINQKKEDICIEEKENKFEYYIIYILKQKYLFLI